MKIKISIPNDYNSERDEQAAIDECYDGYREEAVADEFRNIYFALADAAESAGLKYVCETDFGAEWEGTEEQVAAARMKLPSWAYVGEIESSEE